MQQLYRCLQDRYVRVVGVHLRYFKGKSDEKELGSANLETTEFVRPYDSTDDCRIFELLDSERVFIFQCQSHVEMEHWMDVIENVRQGVQSQRLIESHAKLLAETPARVRLFDEEGESRFREEILLDLADLYPPTLTEEEEAEQREMHESGQGEEPIVLTVAEHVACATSVIQYLHEFLPDVAKLENCAPRYDILAVMIMLVNGVLAERLMPLMNNANNEVQRCDLVERANLGDLHALINLVANYQSQLKLISCPSNSLPQHMKNPKHTPLFEVLPKVCELYVYGGSLGTKGGAAAHLYDHCNKVWNEVVKQPEEMLQKHQDGTFYTHAPIDMWEAINQHISLATSTNSPILHVMIADKVVSSLNKVVLDIIDYVQSLKSVIRPELKDIELEFVCALANDTALHIEESIELIENFSMPEIRDRIDDIFDSLTTNLVTCGQACLQRLASLVMHDVRDLLNEVFTPDWLEGNQIHSAVATLSDYMGDFQDFLVSFWADKFVYTILEEVTLTYTRSVVFHKPINGSNKAVSPVPASAPPKRGFFSSFGFNSIKEIITVNDSRSGLCAVDPDSLGRLAQDVNILNAFFSKKAGQEIASEFLEIISEISLMLFQDIDAITIHTISRISLLPSAADVRYLFSSTSI